MIRLLLVLLAATAGALGARALHVPGGLIVGALIGAGTVSLLFGAAESSIPGPLQTGALIVIGAVVGVQLTPSVLASLPRILLLAVVSALVIIACGVGIAFVLRLLGLAPRVISSRPPPVRSA